MNWKKLMLTGAAIAAVSFAEAKTAYVSSGGDDASGAVDNPDLPFATLNTALTKLTTGDVLQLKDGTLTLTETFTLNKAVTVQGNPNDRRAAVINVNSTSEKPYRGIYINTKYACVRDLTVSNAVISGGNEYGGGIRVDGGYSAVSNCVITCCRKEVSPGGGGAALSLQGQERIDGVFYTRPTEAYDCEFVGNHSESRGGAVFTNAGEDRVIKCVFSNNSAYVTGTMAASAGGAAYGFEGQYIDCTFENNFASGDGGGLCISTSAPTLGRVERCTFRDNVTLSGGSGFAGYAEKGVTDCLFANGISTNASLNSNAGAVYFFRANATNYISNCVISNNLMYGNFGVGVCVKQGKNTEGYSRVVVKNCDFIDNRELVHPGYINDTETKPLNPGWCSGGAIALSTQNPGLSLDVEGCRFIRNVGTSTGAGVNFYGRTDRGPSEVRNCLFEGNRIAGRSPQNGGAIAGQVNLTVYNCTIVTNSAGGNGGGIYMGDATYGHAKVYNTVFIDNTKGTGTADDIAIANKESYADDVSNCAAFTAIAGSDNVPLARTDSIFTDAANGDYTLAMNSVLINKGLNFDWMVGASDIRGNARKFPRIRKDGVNIVDIGCYEYWIAPGLLLLVR